LAKLGGGGAENDPVTVARIAVPLALAGAFAFAALAAAPRAFEAQICGLEVDHKLQCLLVE
jgi:hypothetical protein